MIDSQENEATQMETGAWSQTDFEYPMSVPTMISKSEKQYLFWLAEKVWQGRGIIIEIGPWLGGSTICLAAGMKASGNQIANTLVVLDNFIWRDFMSSRANLPIKTGDSFESFFRKNLSEYSEMLNVHRRALPDEKVDNDYSVLSGRFQDHENVPIFDGLSAGDDKCAAIEILFIDGAKSWRGIKHLLVTLSDQLLPNCLIVCQDFKYWGAYWVPLMISQIQDHLEPVHNVVDATTVTFRLTSPIDLDRIRQLPDHINNLPTDQSLSMIDQIADALFAESGDLGCWSVPLSKTKFLGQQGHIEQAAQTLKKIQGSWPSHLDTAQLEQARDYLRNDHDIRIRRSWPLEFRRMIQYCKRKLTNR